MGRMLRGLALALPLALGAGPVHARHALPSQPSEYSLVVEGNVDIDPSGTVTHCELDHADAFSRDVRDLIARAADTWRFEPVRIDGRAVAARTHMRLLLVAKPAAGGALDVRIRHGNFDDPGVTAQERPSLLSIRRPVYPGMLDREGVAATVYMLLRISHEGRAIDAVVQEVDLRTQGTPDELARWRDAFGRASLSSAMTMRANVPAHGALAGKDSFVVQMPFRFELGAGPPAPGVWEEYLPGPVTTAPWDTASFAPGGLPEGQVRVAGEGLHLLTPLDG